MRILIVTATALGLMPFGLAQDKEPKKEDSAQKKADDTMKAMVEKLDLKGKGGIFISPPVPGIGQMVAEIEITEVSSKGEIKGKFEWPYVVTEKNDKGEKSVKKTLKGDLKGQLKGTIMELQMGDKRARIFMIDGPNSHLGYGTWNDKAVSGQLCSIRRVGSMPVKPNEALLKDLPNLKIELDGKLLKLDTAANGKLNASYGDEKVRVELNANYLRVYPGSTHLELLTM